MPMSNELRGELGVMCGGVLDMVTIYEPDCARAADAYGINSSAGSDVVRDSHGNADIDVVYAQYFNLEKIQEWVGPYTQTLAEYDFIRTVGQGAFGSAKLYQKRDDCTYVILKAVNLHRLSTKERQLALNEHVVLGMLDHPNVIRYFDCFEDNGTLQIEMEYADGGTLAQVNTLTSMQCVLVNPLHVLVNKLMRLHTTCVKKLPTPIQCMCVHNVDANTHSVYM